MTLSVTESALETPDTTADTELKAEHPWRSLEPERFQVLRLNALPADRETGQKPHKDINTLEVWADHKQQQIHINPDFPLRCDPANRGLGRFLLAQAALWAGKRWGFYTVASQPLLIKYATNDAARLRRDHALQAQGFSVTYEDAVQMRAVCSVGRVSQLHSDWNDNKVSVISAIDSATMLQNADQKLNEQNVLIKKLNEHITRLKSEDSTLRFTISILAIFAVFQAALLIWIATR
jgi:hypothetical protein